MRTFSIAIVSLVMTLSASVSAGAGTVTFRSGEDALNQGISAFKGGYYELALSALDAALAQSPDDETASVLARFYQAQIYADMDGSYTDLVRAWRLYKGLADELRNVDPIDNELAPVAAKALTEVSHFLRRGLPAAKLNANPFLADRELYHAALTFNDEKAQFELAKVLLRGEGPELALGRDEDPDRKIQNGVHWLSRLSRGGHAGAQAILADLLWRGKFVPKDQATALSLIDVAVANAPPEDRVWIEDIYQNIFCNAGEGVRRQATGQVAEWRDRYGRRQAPRADLSGLGNLSASPVRACANGEVVRAVDAPADIPENAVSGIDTPGAVSPAEALPDVSTSQAPAFAPATVAPRGLDAGFPMPSFQQR